MIFFKTMFTPFVFFVIIAFTMLNYSVSHAQQVFVVLSLYKSYISDGEVNEYYSK